MKPNKPAKETVYHLVSPNTLEAIQSGQWTVIEPRSHPFWSARYDQGGRRQILERAAKKHNVELDIQAIKDRMRRKAFNVCISDPRAKAWKQVGLGTHLIEQITGNTNEGINKLYSVKHRADVRELHVRDHYYASPAYYQKTHGEDLWSQFLNQPQAFYDAPTSDKTQALFEGLAKYFATTTPHGAYNDNYICEELWYGKQIPLKQSKDIKEITDGLDTFKD